MKLTYPLRLPLTLILAVVLMQGCSSFHAGERTTSEALPPPAQGPLVDATRAALGNRQQDQQSGFYLLNDGLSAFVARVSLIETARTSLDLQYYIFSDDITGRIIISRLLEAADRGVRVRLLVDDLGTRVDNPLVATLHEHPNIQIRLFNPVKARGGLLRLMEMGVTFGRTNHRMHNKLMLADSLVMIAGGRNLGDEYFSNTNLDFQDVDVLTTGPVVQAGMQSFDDYWNSQAALPVDRVLDADDADMALVEMREALQAFLEEQRDSEFVDALRGSSLGRKLVAGEVPLEWGTATLYADPPNKALSHTDTPREEYLLNDLKKMLENAEQRLQISSAYFVPGKRGVALFSDKEKEGVEVSILTNSLSTTDVAIVHSGYSRYRKPLLESGVELWELRAEAGQRQRMRWFQGESRASLHAKTFVIDHDRSFIGSVNLDGRSLIQNTEVGLLIESEALNHQLSTLFDRWVASDSAWHLSLDEEQKLQWRASANNEALVFNHDPQTSRWQRFRVWLLSWLPIESQI
jgi:cardiolipin synthase C